MPELKSYVRAVEIDCPVCKVDAEKNCVDEQGNYRAPHVERGRARRWAQVNDVG
jgi:hypothetical protein